MSGKKLDIVRLTPSGRGAVASLLLRGDGALDALARFWIGPKMFDEAGRPFSDRPLFGRLRLDRSGLCEEVVIHLAGPTEIEIHSHGGEAVVTALESMFRSAGAVVSSWQTLIEAETTLFEKQRKKAFQLLPFAPTQRSAEILLDQYNGALEREWERIERATTAEEKRRRIRRLEENARLGRHLIEPFRVVIAGKTNAGKSTLLNAVIGFGRSIVHETPGTTRDVVTVQTAIDGFPVSLSDTAGIRETDGELERQGIDRTRSALSDADLVLWIVDTTQTQDLAPDSSEIPNLPDLLVGFSKTDLAMPPVESARKGIPFSARTGEGLENLLEQMARRLVPHPPEPQEAVPLVSLTDENTLYPSFATCH